MTGSDPVTCCDAAQVRGMLQVAEDPGTMGLGISTAHRECVIEIRPCHQAARVDLLRRVAIHVQFWRAVCKRLGLDAAQLRIAAAFEISVVMGYCNFIVSMHYITGDNVESCCRRIMKSDTQDAPTPSMVLIVIVQLIIKEYGRLHLLRRI